MYLISIILARGKTDSPGHDLAGSLLFFLVIRPGLFGKISKRIGNAF